MTDADRLLTRFLLALCLWREARGESLRGKRLVAATIRNRVADKRWPNTYPGVITQRWQFSAFNAGDTNALLFPAEGDPAWEECVAMADAELMADAPLSEANHYHTRGVSPTWRRDDQIVDREGAHIFYAL
jgi:spore germination cell wall hydrolase CwlJ-like protein